MDSLLYQNLLLSLLIGSFLIFILSVICIGACTDRGFCCHEQVDRHLLQRRHHHTSICDDAINMKYTKRLLENSLIENRDLLEMIVEKTSTNNYNKKDHEIEVDSNIEIECTTDIIKLRPVNIEEDIRKNRLECESTLTHLEDRISRQDIEDDNASIILPPIKSIG